MVLAVGSRLDFIAEQHVSFPIGDHILQLCPNAGFIELGTNINTDYTLTTHYKVLVCNYWLFEHPVPSLLVQHLYIRVASK